MQIRDDVVAFLKIKQMQLMETYKMLEDIQGEHPELYSFCQKEMDRADQNAESLRRKIDELECPD